jgi:bifunctional enzyme CysN/CysC
MDLLRVATAGSVDDGKSTLIGRLLFETGSIFDDQLKQILLASERRGDARANLALIADGLRAEREQDITIDVAHKYFQTARRRFIIADTPGHAQYTRNMVTGASTADAAIVLVDATRGATTQSRRHAFVASLLGIPHIIVVVNKMDLVGYAAAAYEAVVADVSAFAARLTVQDISFVPVSALEGDNVVAASPRMPWYPGGPLLHRLEMLKAGARRNTIDFRFPVQHTVRTADARGYAGTAVSGSLSVGAEIVVLPSAIETRVRGIETFDGPRGQVHPGEAVVLTTTDEVDVSRGDMIVPRRNLPTVTSRLDAYVCWMVAPPLTPGKDLLLLHTTQQVRARVERIEYLVDVDTLHRATAVALQLHDIGRVEIVTSRPLFVDSYRINAATGSFVLVDPQTNETVAAGMIRGEARGPGQRHTSPGVLDGSSRWSSSAEGTAESAASPPTPGPPASGIPLAEREARQGHAAAVIWLTGLSGAGKTTIATLVERRLFDRGCQTSLLDGDQIRHGLCRDLGFSPDDRTENIRRAGEVAALFYEQGSIVLCAFISPYRRDRAAVRALVPEGRFLEVFISADADTCRGGDPKQLYARAHAGQIPQFTGVSAPYEPPIAPELVLDTTALSPDAAADAVVRLLEARGILRG